MKFFEENKNQKIIAISIASLLLIVAVVVSIFACGNTNNDDKTDDNQNEITSNDVIPDVDHETLGYLFYEKLVEVKTANPAATAEDVVNAIMESKLGTAVPGCMPMPVEADTPLQGIGTDGATFGGFKSGMVIMPMMMGVPFVTYVFELDEGVDVKAFANNLKDLANPAWNVCTSAEMTVVGSSGNLVILAMCQKDIPASVSGKAVIIDPAFTEGSEAASIWESFKTVMSEYTSLEFIAEEIATNLSDAGVAGEVAGVTDIIKNDAFVHEIDSYNAATITNGDKTVYIFQLDFGIDVPYWAEYNCEATEGSDVVYGAYNETVIVMVNLNK